MAIVHRVPYHWYTCTVPVPVVLRMYVLIMLCHNVRTRVPWYTCTNITLSQKRLEIQALNGTRVRTRVRTYVHGYVRTYTCTYTTRVPKMEKWYYTCTYKINIIDISKTI